MKKTVYCLLFLFLVSSLVMAASLDETLESLSGQAAVSYVNPIVSAFGSNLNGGWFHRAPKKDLFAFRPEFGLVFMGSIFPKDDQHFVATGDFRFTGSQVEALVNGVDFSIFGTQADEIEQALINKLTSEDFTVNLSGPTIVGPDDENIEVVFVEKDIPVIIEVAGNPVEYNVTVPGHLFTLPIGGLLNEAPLLPLMAPQLKLGTLFGTQATFRYLPTYDIPDIGKFDYFGFGIQHNPKAWISAPIPFQICLSFFTQTMTLGDYVKATSTAYGINASKTLGWKFLSITPYVGYMLENANMVFEYEYDPGTVQGQTLEPINVKFDIDGKNKSRLTLGTTFRLGVFNINADYNMGKYDSFTAGFAIGI
jgi:hypothetical protein